VGLRCSDPLVALTEYTGNLCLGVRALVLKEVATWDGSSWEALGPAGMLDEVDALCAYDGKMCCQRYFLSDNGEVVSRVEAWDGVE